MSVAGPEVAPLHPIAPSLWAIHDHLRAPGGVRLPVRATVARLPDGGLLVHSPTRLREGLAGAVAALGPVRHLVSPCLFHHLWMGEWAATFPQAAVWGPPGLKAKRPDLRLTGTFGPGQPAPPWSQSLQPLALAGCPRLEEVVFYHPTTRTVLCTDLLFNVLRPQGWATRLALTTMGTNGRLGMSRLWRFYGQDRPALKATIEEMLRWDFVRLVPGHGEVLEGESTREQARAAMRWALR